MHNIEKNAFRKGEYTGYSSLGHPWRVHKDKTSRLWHATSRQAIGGKFRSLTALNLKDLAAKLAAFKDEYPRRNPESKIESLYRRLRETNLAMLHASGSDRHRLLQKRSQRLQYAIAALYPRSYSVKRNPPRDFPPPSYLVLKPTRGAFRGSTFYWTETRNGPAFIEDGKANAYAFPNFRMAGDMARKLVRQGYRAESLHILRGEV